MTAAPVFKKTRIAPTPSGFLHLGNVLSFAVTAALAEKANATILLRIDDIDKERVQPEYVQDIFDTLHFLEIPWHEGPRNVEEYKKEYSQLHRMEMYREALQQLRESDVVFACSCSRTQISRNGNEGIYPGTCRHRQLSLNETNICWRLRTEPITLSVKTTAGTITTAPLPDLMQDVVVRKKDTFPAYQLTSVLDDLHYGIDCIVRGQDLWPSTLAQHYLAMQLSKNDFSNISFLHHPLLLESGGQKLSKSAGATSIQHLRKEGKTPADIYSMIARMSGIETPVHNWQALGNTLLSVC